MTNRSSKSTDLTPDLAPSRRPVASASLADCMDSGNASREESYQSMFEISLSLMSYVRSELGVMMTDIPEIAADLGPMLKVLHEVTLDLETHRQIVEAQ